MIAGSGGTQICCFDPEDFLLPPPPPPPPHQQYRDTNGLIEARGTFNLPSMATTICREKLTKGRHCKFANCRYKHINRFTELGVNDQKILFDYVELNTNLDWAGAKPQRPEGPVSQNPTATTSN
mmetsp:Transcript_6793/g.13252  ORF Transcript_6793/g.13252 Transcript_6793/m.13252 type:complete len:124 (-) Transcript_6793:242-613(-)